MTHITGRLVHADGVEAYGRCVISWPSFSIYGVSIAGGMMYLEITDGTLACDLYPCGAAVPPGMYYTARFELDSGAVYEEYWIVPDSPNVTLEQIRVAFPVAPGLAVSPTQITGMGAQPGMILSWNGSNWVGGWVQVANVDPNYIRLEVGTTGTDFWIEGSPVMLGASARLNLPDASPTARGVVTTGPQSFGGNKTFVGTIDSPTIVALDARLDALEATGANVKSVFGRTGAVVSFPGDYVVAQVTGAVPDTRSVLAGLGMTGGGALTGNITLNAKVTSVQGRIGDVVIDANDISVAGGVPATRQVIAGTGMTGGGPLSSDVVLNANMISVFGRTGEVALLSTDITGAGGVLAIRKILAGTGLTGGGDLTQDRTLSVADNQTIQKLEIAKGGVVIGTHKQLNFQEGSNITLNVANDIPNDRVNVTVTAVPIGGASPSNYWVNGGLIGTRPTLNLIQGPNTIVEGLDQIGGNRVDVTITAGAGAAVPTTRQVIAGYGLTGGGALSADVTLAVVDGQSVQNVQVAKNSGPVIGPQKQINFVEGSNITLTIFDSPVNNRVDVTINSSISGVPSTRQIIAGYGLTGGGDLSANRTLAVVDGASIQKVEVAQTGTVMGTQRQINFVPGLNTNVTVTNVGASNRVDVKIDSAAGGQNQTPWLSNHDAAGFALSNASGVSIKSTSWPTYTIQHGTTLAKARFLMATSGSRLDLNTNLYFDGTNWMRDDVALNSGLYSQISGGHVFYIAAAGANPATSAVKSVFEVQATQVKAYQSVDVTGDVNISGAYKINGVPITGGAQTPWVSDIDAANHKLNNLWVLKMVGGSTIGHPTIDTYIEGVMRWSHGVNYQSVDWGLYRQNASGVGLDQPISASSATGYVGINNPNPVARLDVVGPSQPSSDSGAGAGMFRLSIGNVNTAKCLLMGVDNAGYSWLQAIQAGVAHQSLALNPNGGSVGIRTTTPAGVLHVREGVDQNLIFTPLSGVTAIQATNDAVAAYVPLRYEASAHYLMSGNVGVGTTNVSEGRLTVEGGDLMIRSGWKLNMRRADNGWNMAIQQTSLQLDILSGGGGAAIASFVHGGAVIVPGTFRCGTVNDRLIVTSQNLTQNYDASAVVLRETPGAVAGTFNGAPRIGFWWNAQSIAFQIGLGSSGILSCLTWNADNYSNFQCATLYGYAGSFSGNVQAGTFNTFAISDGAGVGANQIVRTQANGYTYLSHINHGITGAEESGGLGFFMCKWPGADNFLRGFTVQTVTNTIANTSSAVSYNIQNAAGGLLGFVTGHGRGLNQYGALYWDSSDQSINMYHSGKGYMVKVTPQGLYLVGIDSVQAQAGTGKIYKSGNTLMIS